MSLSILSFPFFCPLYLNIFDSIWLREPTNWKLNSSPPVGQCGHDHQDWDCPCLFLVFFFFTTYCDCVLWNFYSVVNMMLWWDDSEASYLILAALWILPCNCSAGSKTCVMCKNQVPVLWKISTIVFKGGRDFYYCYIRGFEKKNKDVCQVITRDHQATPNLIK